jgi:predicted  nucleic acid-binding Zn ribbon protein
MLLTEYVFVPRLESTESKGELADAVQGLFAAFSKNGQVWGEEVWGWVDGALRVMCTVPQPDALSSQHHSRQAVADFERVASLCSQPPRWRVLDDRAKRPTAAHRWQAGPGLYLFTTMFDATSPVCDGANGEPIPLYVLPVDEQVREALRFWMARYKIMDELQLNSSTLEVDAYRELADPASELAKQGRLLAKTIEETTRLPTFYYLMRYWGRRNGEEGRLCPSCGGAWAVGLGSHQRGLGWFDFRCEPCRLVSHVGVSLEDERRAQIGEWPACKPGQSRRHENK